MAKFASGPGGKGGESVSVSYSDTTQMDAFGHLRISFSNVLLSSNHARNILLTEVWDVSSSIGAVLPSASYDASRASFKLYPGTGVNKTIARQTKQYFTYHTGHSQRASLTFINMQPETGVRKRIGMFDANDGIFLETHDSNTYMVIRSSVDGVVTENRVEQADWNVNKLNGTELKNNNLSLDLSKGNIFTLDYQWLGVGRVRTGFVNNGDEYTCHKFDNANSHSSVYMRTPHLPVRYEITNIDNITPSPYLEQVCSSVVREGGGENRGKDVVSVCFNQGTTATTTARSVLSMRLKNLYNRIAIQIDGGDFQNRGTEPVLFQLVLNPTLAGTLVWTDDTSFTQKSITQLSYTANTGILLGAAFLDSGGGRQAKDSAQLVTENILKLVSNIEGDSDIVSIIATSITGTQSVDATIIGVALI